MTLISFKEFITVNESFYNYLQKDKDNKQEFAKTVFELIQQTCSH
jgi:hypothetical protein